MTGIVTERVRKSRADGHKTGLAGEFFVAAEVTQARLVNVLTLGNAKAIDSFAVNDKGTQFKFR